ncbi:MAG: DNA recombination protein RmuC [Pseudomonadota bacterium]
MSMLTPAPLFAAAQDGTDGAARDRLAEAASAVEPLISGPNAALWVGFGAFIIIFLLLIIAIIRGRVVKPAERRAHQDANFFEPAGADADITFDPPASEQGETAKLSKRELRRREKEARKSQKDHREDGRPHEREKPVSPLAIDEVEARGQSDESAEVEDNTPGRFSGLFGGRSKKKKHVEEREQTPEEHEAMLALTPEGPPPQNDHLADVTIERREPVPAPQAQNGHDQIQAAAQEKSAYEERRRALEAEAAERAVREAAEYERAEAERRRALEDAERARAEADESRRQVEVAREHAEREAAFERRKAEAALEQRMQSLQDMQRKLNDKTETLSSDAQAIHHRIGASLDQKFDHLSAELFEKLNAAASQISRLSAEIGPEKSLAVSSASDTLAEIMAREADRLARANEAAIAGLAERIDALSAMQAHGPDNGVDIKRLNALLAERGALGAAGPVQLSELLRSALPANRYQFDKALKNGAIADAMITAPNADAPFAIDARFPAEAYDALARASDNERNNAENAYRRAVLRHMVFIAEKLIAPGETADFAIMFVPADTIFSHLHHHFSDIVQDSHRARIWIVSPTSLMATLHMMGAAAARFSQEKEEAKGDQTAAFRDEIASMRMRITHLEKSLADAVTLIEEERLRAQSQSADAAETAEAYEDNNEPDLFFDAGEPAAAEAALADAQPREQFSEETVEESAAERSAPEPADRRQKDIPRPPFPLR